MWPWSGQKMIFLHVPKCGGSYAARHFGLRFKRCPTLRWPEARGHLTYRQYSAVFAERDQDIHKNVIFTIVRNPWDWHVSWYHYIKLDTGGRRSGMALEHEQIKSLTFSEYLAWLNDGAILKSKNDYCRKNISDWLINDSGKVCVDEVLRQEQLSMDLDSLARKYNLKLRKPKEERINASRVGTNYRAFYSDSDAELIKNRHSQDIERFGYVF